MLISKIILLIFLIVLVAFQIIVVKSWSKPADWYLIWTSCLIIPAILFAYPEYEWNMSGILWWLCSCFMCSIGSIFGKQYRIKLAIRGIRENFWSVVDYRIILCSYFILGIMYSVILLETHGFSLFSIRNMSQLYSINNYMQGYRYSKMDINEGVIQQICLSFTYALPLCGGFLFKKENKYRMVCFGTILPNILITLLNNTKTGIIIAVILFMAGYIIRYLMENGCEPKLNLKFIGILLGILLIFLVFMFFAIKLRYNSDTRRGTSDYIMDTLKDYIFGCVVNFDHYFSVIKDMDSIKSFDFLAGSNILTANTYWIKRYGYVGTLVLWTIRGFISGSAYNNIITDRKKAKGIDIVILIYVYLNAIYFFTYMPFSYQTVCVGVFVLFPFFLYIYRKQSVDMRSSKKNEIIYDIKFRKEVIDNSRGD